LKNPKNPSSRIDIKEGIYFSNCQQLYDTFKQGRRRKKRAGFLMSFPTAVFFFG
jgi:hypothetical protein